MVVYFNENSITVHDGGEGVHVILCSTEERDALMRWCNEHHLGVGGLNCPGMVAFAMPGDILDVLEVADDSASGSAAVAAVPA